MASEHGYRCDMCRATEDDHSDSGHGFRSIEWERSKVERLRIALGVSADFTIDALETTIGQMRKENREVERLRARASDPTEEETRLSLVRAWRALQNLASIAGEECGEEVAMGRATSAVSRVVRERDALREALSELVSLCEVDESFNDATNEPDSYAALIVAREALRCARR